MDSITDTKQQKLHAENLRKYPPAKAVPKLEKGLSESDRKKGWRTYMQRGRA